MEAEDVGVTWNVRKNILREEMGRRKGEVSLLGTLKNQVDLWSCVDVTQGWELWEGNLHHLVEGLIITSLPYQGLK